MTTGGNRIDNRTGKGLARGRRGQPRRYTAQGRRIRLAAIFLAVLALAAGAAAYLFMNRTTPPVELVVAAGPYRTDSYELMEEIADVVERQSQTLRLKVEASRDSSENIALLNERKADLGTIRSDTPVAADIVMVADLFPDYFQIIAGPGSGIFRIRDLQGKRIAIPPFGTDEFRSFWAVADHYDISVSGVRWQAMPFVEAGKRLLSGELDAIFTVRSLRDRLVLNLFEDAQLKGRMLSLVEIEQAPAIAIKRPFLKSLEIPKGTYGGEPPVPGRTILSASVTRTLVARSDIDPAPVRELTRILFENRFDLIIRFALASAIQQPSFAEGLSIPLHPGAAQYYDRDKPTFLQENAEPIALMITILAMIGSGLIALRSRLMSGQKNRMDSYNYQLLDIAEAARETLDPERLRQLRSELFDILETVVRALDTDEVTEEGFQSFSLLWESVRVVLADRLGELETRAR